MQMILSAITNLQVNPLPSSRAVAEDANTADILAYVDGALLVDLWDDLVLPRPVRSAWTPVIHASREMAASLRGSEKPRPE